MASSTKLQSCSKCQKSQGQASCAGCERWFCIKHLLEHRQDLSRELEKCVFERDQLQVRSIADVHDRQGDLLTRVDRWEAKSIETIKQLAQQVRYQLNNSLSWSRTHVEEALRPIASELEENRKTDDYTERELKRWMSQLKALREQLEKAPMVELMHDEDERSSTHFPLIQLRIPEETKGNGDQCGRDVQFRPLRFSVRLAPFHITDQTRWSIDGRTLAGGQGQGGAPKQLHLPFSFDVGDDGSFFIADTHNHRIVRWRLNAKQGEIVVAGKGSETRTDQLNQPCAVLIDRTDDCLIISDHGNGRVIRWSLQKSKQRSMGEKEVILSDTHSFGLATDNRGSLYVSDFVKHEVRRYAREEEKEGVIVAGGNGQGASLNQLNSPRQIFVDANQSVYVSDSGNHRVMKWTKGAAEGVVVAGGQDRGNSLGQLYYPSGIFADRLGSVYVADELNHRVMRWVNEAKEGEMIVGGNGRGSQNNQLNQPTGIALDDCGNLCVADQVNHRIQRFQVSLASSPRCGTM